MKRLSKSFSYCRCRHKSQTLMAIWSKVEAIRTGSGHSLRSIKDGEAVFKACSFQQWKRSLSCGLSAVPVWVVGHRADRGWGHQHGLDRFTLSLQRNWKGKFVDDAA